jgi:hypothetical protein
LPDFSWYKIPEREKYTKMTTKYTKQQENRRHVHEIYHHLSFKDASKFTQTAIFWFESIPSDNTAWSLRLSMWRSN